jgi:hypothetical protein
MTIGSLMFVDPYPYPMPPVVSTASMHSLGLEIAARQLSAPAGFLMGAPDDTQLIGFVVTERYLVTKLFIAMTSGGTGANLDMGIYTEDGRRVVNHGGLAPTATDIQEFDITDTWLDPGRYYWAFSCQDNSPTARPTLYGWSLGAVFATKRTFGPMASATLAYPLPATVTLSSINDANPNGDIPLVGMSNRSIIA